jgi:hypothetical protein
VIAGIHASSIGYGAELRLSAVDRPVVEPALEVERDRAVERGAASVESPRSAA